MMVRSSHIFTYKVNFECTSVLGKFTKIILEDTVKFLFLIIPYLEEKAAQLALSVLYHGRQH